MQTAPPSRPEVLVTGTASKLALPEWVRPYSAKAASLNKVRALRHLAPLTVVFGTTPEAMAKHEILSVLASRQRTTARPSKIVFVFDEADARAQDLATVLESFARVDDVELARGPEQRLSARSSGSPGCGRCCRPATSAAGSTSRPPRSRRAPFST